MPSTSQQNVVILLHVMKIIKIMKNSNLPDIQQNADGLLNVSVTTSLVQYKSFSVSMCVIRMSIPTNTLLYSSLAEETALEKLA